MLEIGNSGFRADGEQEGKTASSHQTDCSNEKQTSTIYYETLSVIQHRATKIEVKFFMELPPP